MTDQELTAIALRSFFDFVILLMLTVTLLCGGYFATNGGKRSVWVCGVVVFCAFVWWLQGSFIIDVIRQVSALSGVQMLVVFVGIILMAFVARKTNRIVTMAVGAVMAIVTTRWIVSLHVSHDLFTAYEQQLRVDFSTAMSHYVRDKEIRTLHKEIANIAGTIAGVVAILGVIGGNLIGFLFGRIGNNAVRWTCYLGAVLTVYPMVFIFIIYVFPQNMPGWIPVSLSGYLGGLVLGAINARNRIRKPKELHEKPES